MIDKTKPMTLGDIFSNTFSITGKAFLRNLVIAAIFLIPAGLLLGIGFQTFFSNIADISQSALESADDIKPSGAMMIIASGMLYLFSLLIFLLCNLAAMIGITKTSAGEVEGIKVGLSEAFSKIFSAAYLRAVGLVLLIFLIFLALIVFIVMMVAFIGTVENWPLKFIGVITIIVSILFMIYLLFRWYFSFVNIVVAEEGIIDSMKKSSFLVKGYWWRTFGIIILISIVVGFASSLISTPLSFLFMWDFISEYMNDFSSGTMNDDPAANLRVLKSLGLGYGFTIGFSTILQSLILPVSYIIMYYDLKARKNDYPAPPAEGNTGEDYTRSWDMPVE